MWNYRIIRHPNRDSFSFQIHEVYYDNEGNIEFWTERSSGVYGETFEELKSDLLKYKEAFNKPILETYISDNGVEFLRELLD